MTLMNNLNIKALILGSGRIGRGFVTQLLFENSVECIHFDSNQELVNLLNKCGRYTIHVMGYPELDTHVTNVRAYLINDVGRLAKEWSEADLIFSAVGGKNLPSLGKNIGKAFKVLYDAGKVKKSNIITCENWVNPADDLNRTTLEQLTEEGKKVFQNNVGITEGVILTTGTGSPDGIPDNPADTWVQNFKYLPVDKSRIKGEIPRLKYFDFIDDFGNLLKQKLYTNNTSVALVAYLGHLKGIKYVADAANHPDIVPILEEAYREINDALIKGMNIDEESQRKFSIRAKNKYQDRNIIDLVTRIARDPLRKLRKEDRLIGCGLISIRSGGSPKAIALATAAALYYDEPTDKGSVELQKMRKEKGIDYILTNISELTDSYEDKKLRQMIHEAVDKLKSKGWIKEG